MLQLQRYNVAISDKSLDKVVFCLWFCCMNVSKSLRFIAESWNLADTLPRAYEYELFGDYLRPYLVAKPYRKYQANDVLCFLYPSLSLSVIEFQANDFFTYQGVQFKAPSDFVAAHCV